MLAFVAQFSSSEVYQLFAFTADNFLLATAGGWFFGHEKTQNAQKRKLLDEHYRIRKSLVSEGKHVVGSGDLVLEDHAIDLRPRFLGVPNA